MDAIIKRANLTTRNFSQPKPTYRSPQTGSNPPPGPPHQPPKPPYNNPTDHTLSHRKLLTASEMRARREKNLCYNCDETFVPGHRCKQRQIYVMMSEEEEVMHNSLIENENLNEIENESPGEDMIVSLNALSRTTDMNTLRIKGTVNGQDIHILIDSGSTHCFLDEGTAYKLGCRMDYTTPLLVSVADGSKMVSRLECPEFSWTIQNHTFSYPIRVIKLGGYDMVLGGDWLRQNSPVEFDYQKMKLTISRQGKKITMKAITDSASLQLISAKSFSKLFKKKGVIWHIWTAFCCHSYSHS
ncbi:hypothetical protein BUALT_Bualt17G0102900 [Buddleja alternifolia]|uniref:Uncharacterized protein n=1 Tax=Buddleja alternifolia TaxID=168488 RepID=A0AAV6WGR2_9LAMI|nr:hypothetical protein BUALT_Bualt17G0102900 [Buddleja alternifolia]